MSAPPPSYYIREMVESDLDEVTIRVFKSVMPAERALLTPTGFSIHRTLQNILNDNTSTCLLAVTSSGAGIGCVALQTWAYHPLNHCIKVVSTMFRGVAPEWQKLGIGRALLDAAERWARSQQADLFISTYGFDTPREVIEAEIGRGFTVMTTSAVKDLRIDRA